MNEFTVEKGAVRTDRRAHEVTVTLEFAHSRLERQDPSQGRHRRATLVDVEKKRMTEAAQRAWETEMKAAGITVVSSEPDTATIT